MVRNVDFEIPYFKKQAEKTQHQLSDQEHKHEEYLHNAEAATKEFKQVCSSLSSPECLCHVIATNMADNWPEQVLLKPLCKSVFQCLRGT